MTWNPVFLMLIAVWCSWRCKRSILKKDFLSEPRKRDLQSRSLNNLVAARINYTLNKDYLLLLENKTQNVYKIVWNTEWWETVLIIFRPDWQIEQIAGVFIEKKDLRRTLIGTRVFEFVRIQSPDSRILWSKKTSQIQKCLYINSVWIRFKLSNK